MGELEALLSSFIGPSEKACELFSPVVGEHRFGVYAVSDIHTDKRPPKGRDLRRVLCIILVRQVS